jgi:hypothetical protein
VTCDFQDMDLPMLGSALFEHGWLGACHVTVTATSNIGLGDVVYMAENGLLVVVDNLHNHMMSTCGDGLPWGSCPEGSIEDTEVVKHSKIYRRCR